MGVGQSESTGEKSVKLTDVNTQPVASIAHPDQHTAHAAPLDGTLTESGGIGKPTVVENVVEVETPNAGFESVERGSEDGCGVYFLVERNAFDFIVVTGAAVEEINPDLRTVEAQVELFLVIARESSQSDGVAQEHPSPTHVRPELDSRLGSKSNRKAVVGVESVELVGVSVLDHHGEVVFLWFDVMRIHSTEVFNKLVECSPSPFEERLFLTDRDNRRPAISHQRYRHIACSRNCRSKP